MAAIYAIWYALQAKRYWMTCFLKIAIKKKLNAFSAAIEPCQCAYYLQPGVVYKVCETCGGRQKHGRWRS
tara:strand:+ start:346 stop:555 length:210 start_codon:yes stop_codon:yes gene_type:complete